MFNLNLDSGLVEVKLNDNEENTIKFNPTSIGFVERYFELIQYATEQGNKYSEIEKTAMENGENIDKLEVSMNEYKELYNTFVDKIDNLFGKETVKKAKRAVNDDSEDLGLLIQLIDGLGVYVIKASNDKVEKYLNQYKNREQKRATTKKKK